MDPQRRRFTVPSFWRNHLKAGARQPRCDRLPNRLLRYSGFTCRIWKTIDIQVQAGYSLLPYSVPTLLPRHAMPMRILIDRGVDDGIAIAPVIRSFIGDLGILEEPRHNAGQFSGNLLRVSPFDGAKGRTRDSDPSTASAERTAVVDNPAANYCQDTLRGG